MSTSEDKDDIISNYMTEIYDNCDEIISEHDTNNDINSLFKDLENYCNDELSKYDSINDLIINKAIESIYKIYDNNLIDEAIKTNLQNILGLNGKIFSKLISNYNIKELDNPKSDILIRFFNYDIKDNFERLYLFTILLSAIHQIQQTTVDRQSNICNGILLIGLNEIEKNLVVVIKKTEIKFIKKFIIPDLNIIYNKTYNKLLKDPKNIKKYNLILKNMIGNNLIIFRYYTSMLYKLSGLLYEIYYLLTNNYQKNGCDIYNDTFIMIYILLNMLFQYKTQLIKINRPLKEYFDTKEEINIFFNDIIKNFNIISESNSYQKEYDNVSKKLSELIDIMYESDICISGNIGKSYLINEQFNNVLKYILFLIIKYEPELQFHLDVINEQITFIIDRFDVFQSYYSNNLETEKILNAIIEDIERNDLFIKDSEILFTIEGLSHRFDKNIIFENVNLTIPKNNWICLYGNSGTGKTTLIKILLNLLEPDMCTIKYMGKHTDYKYTDLSKDISYVTASPELFENTILYNIVYGVNNSEDKEIQDKMNYYVKLFGLDVCDLKDNVNTLSTGQKQRVSIIRLILQDRPIMILDEITSNIDNEMEKIILEEIRKIQKEKNKTVIHITHNIENKVFSDINLYILNKDIIQVE
jgi:putative ABC transport system ATP-binding protein